MTSGSVYLNNVNIGNISYINTGTFSGSNGTITNSSITGLIFDPLVYRSFTIIASISIKRTSGGNYFAQYTIEGVSRDSGWSIYTSNLGDTLDISISIDSSTGQLQYSSSTTYTNWTSTIFNYHNVGIFI